MYRFILNSIFTTWIVLFSYEYFYLNITKKTSHGFFPGHHAALVLFTDMDSEENWEFMNE